MAMRSDLLPCLGAKHADELKYHHSWYGNNQPWFDDVKVKFFENFQNSPEFFQILTFLGFYAKIMESIY